jgi:hypothetical protein
VLTSSRFPYPYVLWNGQPVLIGSEDDAMSSPTTTWRSRQLELFSRRIIEKPVSFSGGASKATKGGRRSRFGGGRGRGG